MTQTSPAATKAAAEISTTRQQLEAVVAQAKCQVFGWEDAGNAAHRYVLSSVISTAQHELTTVLCEPSLTRSTTRPPDVVVVCPIAGVLVIEVKGIKLEDINAIEPGGQFAIQYRTGARSRNPFAQVRNAMFDIRDAAHRGLDGTLSIPFRYFVSLPNISRSAWLAKWGEAAIIPKELLFHTQIAILLGEATKVGKKLLESKGQTAWPVEELRAVHRAFGDSSVLTAMPEERQPRRVREATLGEMFDEAAEAYKTLSEEQQRLSAQFWETGPRLVRGVAGSGKTIVLANNLARHVYSEA